MRVTLDGAGTTLRLDFESPEALRSFAAEWLKRDGCLVRLFEPLKLWAKLTVELRQAGVRRLAVEAQVVQVFGGSASGYATALQAAEAGALEEVASERPDAREPSTGAPAATDTGSGEMLGASPAFRIRQMNVSERMRLAPKATLGERQILVRDNSPQVLMGLLANPRIEDKEVLALARSPSASSAVLQRIAKDPRWSASYKIRLALVKSPLTPTPLALQMLETLPERDLRTLAKGSIVREVIRAAALRKVVKR